MPVSVIKRDIQLKGKPTNGREAYNYIIEAIHSEIDELQVMLYELSEPKVKEQFIKDWDPNVRTVSVYD